MADVVEALAIRAAIEEQVLYPAVRDDKRQQLNAA